MLLLFLRCLKCGHYWSVKFPLDKVLAEGFKLELPKKCPQCRSLKWNTPLRIV